MLTKTLAGIGLFALMGGAIGYSQVFCPDGGCAITGTPYGGALFGGVLGMAVMTGLGSSSTQPPKPDNQDDDTEPDHN